MQGEVLRSVDHKQHHVDLHLIPRQQPSSARKSLPRRQLHWRVSPPHCRAGAFTQPLDVCAPPNSSSTKAHRVQGLRFRALLLHAPNYCRHEVFNAMRSPRRVVMPARTATVLKQSSGRVALDSFLSSRIPSRMSGSKPVRARQSATLPLGDCSRALCDETAVGPQRNEDTSQREASDAVAAGKWRHLALNVVRDVGAGAHEAHRPGHPARKTVGKGQWRACLAALALRGGAGGLHAVEQSSLRVAPRRRAGQHRRISYPFHVDCVFHSI